MFEIRRFGADVATPDLVSDIQTFTIIAQKIIHLLHTQSIS